MTLADQIQKVRESADRLGDLVDEWNRKFNKDIMTEPIQQPQPQLLNAYVTLPQGGQPPKPPGQKMIPVAVRLKPGQRDKLKRIGVQRMRDWLDQAKENGSGRNPC